MPDGWAVRWTDTWTAGARRFNPNHRPAGAGGGEFASAGSGGGSPAAKVHAAHAAHVAHVAHLANSSSARKATLHVKAQADRVRAHQLQAQLDVLLKQEAKVQAAAKKAAAAAKHAAAAAKHPAATMTAKHHAAVTHRAHRKASAHHASLKSRISTLRTEIRGLLTQASQLDAQAARL